MSILTEQYALSNGVKIPKIGFGTWLVDDDKVAKPVEDAIKGGYRHIDTAQAYENEHGVGEGIRNSGVAREDIFVTTKLAAEIKSYPEAVEAIGQSLKTMGVDYLDMMIIHSPQPWNDFRSGEHYFEGNLEAWHAMEEAYNDGKIRAIGVSNFEQEDLENILENGTIKPMVNQVLAHVSNTPFDLIQYCQKHDILVEAYSPVAHGEILNNQQIKELAEKYNVSTAQLSIRYCLQLGLLPLPKSENPDHIRSNAELDFEISAEDLNKLKQMERIKDYGDASSFPVFDQD
ncbi:aldo/keto reductase [Tetragenococcus koreensis]|uniref:aldo/keto reductase n=1 Tax=Tetragenococcus koreensis TaxID=290335 RepID=UPI001F1E5897|nr:aldo/keto reductase [Tetragenococcus koreensis]MDN6730397.1 aldo/keto reductase [Alkalibacterium sp.]MCF1584106.1 aldo/keto reductase [Tetragenococcus koreensis]MCF1613761.1 aldo/keto reductase [Tetragenococcus koreensis]MCF1618915.1 aldo/keto reductase [Tetragenococcus koreensis]MCF1623539.1 aldo/keto reductase [Tetragenococcus koreensis]